MLYFNQYSTPLLIGFLQGVVYALLLFRRGYREERLSDRLLAFLLLTCCAYIAQYMLGFGNWYDSHDWRSSFMFYFPFHSLIFIGPIMYFYFRSLTNQAFRFRSKDLLHFIPGAVVLAIYTAVFLHDVVLEHWLLGKSFILHFGTQGPWSKLRQDFIPTVDAGLVSMIIYTVLTLRVYQRYRKYLIQNFSSVEGLRFGWLKVLLYILIGTFAINWGVQLLTKFVEISYNQYWTSYFAFAVMVYILSIQGYNSAVKLPSQLKFEPQSEPEVKEVPSKDLSELAGWKKRLSAHMEKEKPYLEPQLTLSDLAQRIGTNASVLSKVINTGFEQNFNDFINDFRVQAMKAKLQDGEGERLTLMSIALDCGFNSKATFNRAFRKFSGMSPREYMDGVGGKGISA